MTHDGKEHISAVWYDRLNLLETWSFIDSTRIVIPTTQLQVWKEDKLQGGPGQSVCNCLRTVGGYLWGYLHAIVCAKCQPPDNPIFGAYSLNSYGTPFLNWKTLTLAHVTHTPLHVLRDPECWTKCFLPHEHSFKLKISLHIPFTQHRGCFPYKTRTFNRAQICTNFKNI